MIPSTAQAHVVVDEWVRGGVREAVAAPGSRNAPLLLALHAADRDGRLRLHVRIDERSAGFLALGLAVRSGTVVPVVVTSGTAVANLHPAVLEASHAGVGLLVVSADRPPELVGSGANQTVDQVGLFGSAVRASIVLPLAEDRPGAARTWRGVIARALDRAAGTTSADPGPVQLDVPLREPLVDPMPDLETVDVGLEGRPGGAPWTRVAPREDSRPPLDLPADARTMVVAGHGGAVVPACAGLPAGIPVLAEPSSSLWTDPAGGHLLRAAPWLLGAVLDAPDHPLRPDHVVVLGRPTLHRGVSRLLADPRVTVHAVPATAPGDGRTRPGWTDVHGAVTAVGALPAPGAWAPDAAFATAWADVDARAAAAIVDDRARSDREELDGSAVAVHGAALAGAVVAALPPGALLVVGASNPIRDVALGAVPRRDVTVLSARGVSGIDGAISFASGAALAHGGPTVALLGDLTFLHDSGGLLAGPHEPRGDLTIVVANDDGGGIFSVLEQGAPPHAAAFERVFGTPHGTDLAALCRAHGVPHRRLGTTTLAQDLAGALVPDGASSGPRVAEVTVDRSGRRDAHLQAGVSATSVLAPRSATP